MRKTVDPLSMIRDAANERTARLSANSTAGINRGETKSILNHFESNLEISPCTAVNSSPVVLSLPGRPEPPPKKLNAKEPWVGVLIHGSHGPGYRIGLSQRFSAYLSRQIFSRDRGLETLATWGAGPLQAFVCKIAKLNTKSPWGEGVKILSGLGAFTALGLTHIFFFCSHTFDYSNGNQINQRPRYYRRCRAVRQRDRCIYLHRHRSAAPENRREIQGGGGIAIA